MTRLDKIITSSARLKILRLFLVENQEMEMHVRGIARRLDLQVNAVRRELSNLESARILKSHKKNVMKVYKTNWDNDVVKQLHKLIEATV